MSIDRGLDLMSEQRAQFAVKCEKEPISKVKIPNISYPNQHTDTEIPHGFRGYIIAPSTIKTTFNLDIKTGSNVKNVDRALVRNKVLLLGSQKIYTINKSDIYGKYKDSYFSKKKREKKLLQGIQPANSLKAQVGVEKVDGPAITVTTQQL